VLDYNQRWINGERGARVFDFRIIDKDGKVRWVEIHASLIPWEGRPSTLVFVEDITRPQTNGDGPEGERKDRQSAPGCNPIVQFLLDTKGTILATNQTFDRIYGGAGEPLVGREDHRLRKPGRKREMVSPKPSKSSARQARLFRART